jgi:hypothetical protein
MQQGQLNLADLNGVLAMLMGPVGGIAASVGRGAAWPLVVFFAILGFGAGMLSVKLLGRAAYACLDFPSSAGSLIAYMLVSLAMPVTSVMISIAIPTLVLARGGAA